MSQGHVPARFWAVDLKQFEIHLSHLKSNFTACEYFSFINKVPLNILVINENRRLTGNLFRKFLFMNKINTQGFLTFGSDGGQYLSYDIYEFDFELHNFKNH